MIEYGMNALWVTAIQRINLLKEGIVSRKLHNWLEKYAHNPDVTPRSRENIYKVSQRYQRHNQKIFADPKEPQLIEIKKKLIGLADEYVKEVFGEVAPHRLESLLWFVRQRQNTADDAVTPHFHERGDVVFCYYLSAPKNGSGLICFVDPRGCIGRGGYAVSRQHPVIAVQPKAGDLIVTPRYLLHYTTTNTEKADRNGICGLLRYELLG
jgi:hypothetical protein